MGKLFPIINSTRQRRGFLLASFFLLIAASITAIVGTNLASASDVVSEINYYSEHANFDNRDGGAWKINKTVRVKNYDRVETTIEVNSIIKGDGKPKDVLFVMDTSGSMRENGKIDAFKETMLEVGGSILANPDNLIGLIDFSTEATILSDFTNNWNIYGTPNLSSKIANLTAGGGTNYYQAIRKMEEFFDNYDFSQNRTPIVLFFTDGEPVEDSPSQIPEYQVFKNRFPNVSVRAIQFDMGNTIVQSIAQVSDVQYIAQIDNLTDTMFEAVEDGYRYDEFIIDDYINNNYFTFESSNSTLGEVAYDAETGKIRWDLSHALRSGRWAKLTFTLAVTDECINNETGVCKTSLRNEISTKLSNMPDEHVVTTDSPAIQFWYDLSYDFNAPSDCEVQGTKPNDTRALIFSTQEVPSNTLSCPGYIFKGWVIGEGGAMRFNDNYFRMPEANTVIRGTWTKIAIAKSMEGEVKPTVHAMFKNGWDFTQNIVRTIQWDQNKVTKLKNADVLPDDFDTTTAYNYSVTDGFPIYIWYDDTDHSLVFYSDADVLDLNPDSWGYFGDNFRNLTDISILKNWNASTSTNLTQFFRSTAITDFSPIADWDVSHVTSLQGTFAGTPATNFDALANWHTDSNTTLRWTFSGSKATDFSGLADWDTSKVTTLEKTFENVKAPSLHGVEDWNTESVTDMQYLFSGAEINDISAVQDWNVSKVTMMQGLFSNSKIQNYHGVENWNVEKVTNLRYAFYGTRNLVSAAALKDWPTHSLVYLSNAFEYSGIKTLADLENWDVSHVTNDVDWLFHGSALTTTEGAEKWDVSGWTSFKRIFMDCTQLTNLSGLSTWRPVSVVDLQSTFVGTTNLKDLSPLADWRTPALTDLYNTFQYSGIINLHGLENWDVHNVTTMAYTFNRAYSLNDISALADWNVAKLTNLSYTFQYDNQLTSLTGLDDWNTQSLTNMQCAFANTGVADISALANWNVGELTTMDNTFSSSKITTLASLSGWRPTKLTNMNYAFASTPLTELGNLNNWTTPALTSLYGTFRGTSITNVDGIANWNTANVTTIGQLFNYAPLTDISGLANWNVSKVENMEIAFEASKLTTLHGLENWNTASLTNLNRTFGHSKQLTDISAIANWDISKVTTLAELFYDCVLLSSTSSLANWNTSNVTSLEGMFRETAITSTEGLRHRLVEIEGKDPYYAWDTSNVRSITRMFLRNYDLADIDALSTWNVGHVTSATYVFNDNRLILDFTPLNSWNTESFDAHSQGTFSNVNPNAIMPSWY